MPIPGMAAFAAAAPKIGEFLQEPLGQYVGQQAFGMGMQGLGKAGEALGNTRIGKSLGLNNLFGPSQESQQNTQRMNDYYQQLQQPIQGDFSGIENDQMRQFQEQILPMIQSQYGRGGGRSTSGYGDAQRLGATDLASRLGALRSQYDMQIQGLNQQRQGMLGNMLGGQQNYMMNKATNAQRGAMGQQDMFRNLLSAYQQSKTPVDTMNVPRKESTGEGLVDFGKKVAPYIGAFAAGGLPGVAMHGLGKAFTGVF